MKASASTKVLVVEDEPMLRMMAIDILEDAGFTVEEAANSREALKILRVTPDVHVLFTDLHMPGEMNGLALAHLVAKDFPGVGVIIVSGHVAPKAHELPKGAVFLAKPYEARRVVAHIQRLRQAA